MSLTLNIATRGRSDRLWDTVTRNVRVMTEADTRLVISGDADDETMTPEFADRLRGVDSRVIVDIRERPDSLGAVWNRALDYPADLYCCSPDHVVYVDYGFDRKFNEAMQVFPDGIGVVYTHMSNKSFPHTQAISQNWVDVLGFLYVEFFPYWFVDHWIDDLARMTERVVLADIDCDLGDKPPTTNLREPGWWATFYDSQRLVRREQADKLLRAISGGLLGTFYEKCVRNFPIHEFRSQMINDYVRTVLGNMPPNGVESSRYLKLKEQATVMMAREFERLEPLLRAKEYPLILGDAA